MPEIGSALNNKGKLVTTVSKAKYVVSFTWMVVLQVTAYPCLAACLVRASGAVCLEICHTIVVSNDRSYKHK